MIIIISVCVLVAAGVGFIVGYLYGVLLNNNYINEKYKAAESRNQRLYRLLIFLRKEYVMEMAHCKTLAEMNCKMYDAGYTDGKFNDNLCLVVGANGKLKSDINKNERG